MVSSRKSVRLVLFIILLANVQGTAQELTGVAGMVNAGFMSTRGFNTSIEKSTPDSIRFGNGYTLVGAEGYYRHGKAILSASGYLGFQEGRPYGENFLERSVWTTHAGFGWILLGNSAFSFYPSVSFGVTGLTLTEYSRHGDPQVDLVNTIIPSADLALHFDYLMLNPNAGDYVVDGIVLGIKTGYNCRVASSSPFQGWYVTASVGGLAFMKKH